MVEKESYVEHEENGFVHGSLSQITFFDRMTCLYWGFALLSTLHNKENLRRLDFFSSSHFEFSMLDSFIIIMYWDSLCLKMLMAKVDDNS